jgi:hypothetical protein
MGKYAMIGDMSQSRSSRHTPCAVAENRRVRASRAGVASLDYVLIIGVVLPCIVFMLGACAGWGGQRGLMQLAYEMVSVLISWPFM